VRHGRFERERRLVSRLIPGWDHATCIGRFELRVQRALLARGRVVVDCEQPGCLHSDLAGVVDRERILTRWNRTAERERRGLLALVRRDLRLGSDGIALAVGQSHLGELHVDRVERDAVDCRQNLDADRNIAAKRERSRVWLELDVITRRPHGARQLRRRGRTFGR